LLLHQCREITVVSLSFYQTLIKASLFYKNIFNYI
jgi:hypothetical protein